MTKPIDYATQANHRLIAQVAEYYQDAKKNQEFYREVDSTVLQEMSEETWLHCKNELHALICDGMNCHERLW